MKLSQQLSLTRRTTIVSLSLLGTSLIYLGAISYRPGPTTNPPTLASHSNVAAKTAKVEITAQGFAPSTIKVKLGTTITWTNQDNAPHQVAADPYPSHASLPGLYSAQLTKAVTYSYTFTTPGTFTYQDYLNPLKLHGTVEVGE